MFTGSPMIVVTIFDDQIIGLVDYSQDFVMEIWSIIGFVQWSFTVVMIDLYSHTMNLRLEKTSRQRITKVLSLPEAWHFKSYDCVVFWTPLHDFRKNRKGEKRSNGQESPTILGIWTAIWCFLEMAAAPFLILRLHAAMPISASYEMRANGTNQ